MLRLKTFAAALAAALLAAPAVGLAEDAPGVFKIPGTESTIKFYGYVQLDMTEDLSARTPNYENWDWATILPGVPDDTSAYAKRAKPQFYMTARTSRFGLQTVTPSSWGPITVKLEGDFNAPNSFQSEGWTNSVAFRLRQAYGSIGGLLVGQTWTNFIDFAATPDTVDFNGPGTLALVRNPQIRYTFNLAKGTTLALAVENARGPQFSDTYPRFQTIPDFHANLSWNGDMGSFSARIVTQRYNVLTVTGGGVQDVPAKSAQSFGFGLSGSLKFSGDTLQAQFAGGPGIGRYLFNTIADGAYGQNAAGDLELITAYGGHLAYTHVWNPTWRSTLVGAYTFVQDPKIDGVVAGNGLQKDFVQGFVNTFWSFSKTAEVGVEYAYGQWKSFGTPELKGTQNRINASFHYNFY